MGVNFFQRDDRDVKFLLFEYLGVEKLPRYEAFEDFSVDDLSMILNEAFKMGREVSEPAN